MRTDTFILRKESPTRQNIIELLMEWIDATVSVGFCFLIFDNMGLTVTTGGRPGRPIGRLQHRLPQNFGQAPRQIPTEVRGYTQRWR